MQVEGGRFKRHEGRDTLKGNPSNYRARIILLGVVQNSSVAEGTIDVLGGI